MPRSKPVLHQGISAHSNPGFRVKKFWKSNKSTLKKKWGSTLHPKGKTGKGFYESIAWNP